MFSHKTVIVTGGAQGIGRGIALAYAEKGANVVIADVEAAVGQQYAQQLSERGYSALFVQTDVREEQSVVSLMEQTIAQFGSIDVLINNAGISPFKNMFELTMEEFDNVYATNLRSVFLCSREAAKRMNSGAIVNMASTRAFMSEPNAEAYAASKGGIVALTHALATSLSTQRITVNSIAPGWIETGDYDALRDVDHEQHLSNRVGQPDDIARACLYLTHPDNNFVNGENLTIDGGMTKKMIYEE